MLPAIDKIVASLHVQMRKCRCKSQDIFSWLRLSSFYIRSRHGQCILSFFFFFSNFFLFCFLSLLLSQFCRALTRLWNVRAFGNSKQRGKHATITMRKLVLRSASQEVQSALRYCPQNPLLLEHSRLGMVDSNILARTAHLFPNSTRT